jgi:hypothetical protein
MSFEIHRASRQAFKPLIGLYSESGCGKTHTSLILARGFVGPKGKIVQADTERGRGSLFADILPGGYETFQIGEPFSPAHYIEAIDFVEQQKADVGIIDSCSHEWEGLGGVLEMAGDNESRSGKQGLHNWRQPKMEHAKFVLRLLQSSIPWIVCLRAKYKTHQGKDDKGKTIIIKDEVTSPIQAEDFVYELTFHAELLTNHSLVVTKEGHPELRKCFPKDKIGPITFEHGKLLADWCAGAGTVKPVTANPAPAASQSTDMKALKKTLVSVAIPKHCPDLESLQQFLHDELFLTPDQMLANQTAEQLQKIITKLEQRPVDQGVMP